MPDPVTAITIRQAELRDVAAIISVLRSIGWFKHFETTSDVELEEVVRHQVALCLEGTSHGLYLASTEAQNVVGYISVHWVPYLMLPAPEGFISELFVKDTARGLGAGRRLLAFVENEARIKGCSRLQLINFRNRESYQRGFYAKAGWKERKEAAVFMRRLTE